jgi:hypothetical protein
MPTIQTHLDTILEPHKHAQAAITHTQELVKTQRDKNTTFHPFTQGQKVWLEATNLKLTHPMTKLAAR